MDYDLEKLRKFTFLAGDSTYAAGDKPVENPEKPGFIELVFEDGDFSYRDSYTGHAKSRGMEVVRYKGTPVWASLYGGGMTTGNEKLAGDTFDFLKQALSTSENGFESLRGSHSFTQDDWKYSYDQEGDFTEFKGHEQIYFKGKLVFFHEVIGGTINHN